MISLIQTQSHEAEAAFQQAESLCNPRKALLANKSIAICICYLRNWRSISKYHQMENCVPQSAALDLEMLVAAEFTIQILRSVGAKYWKLSSLDALTYLTNKSQSLFLSLRSLLLRCGLDSREYAELTSIFVDVKKTFEKTDSRLKEWLSTDRSASKLKVRCLLNALLNLFVSLGNKNATNKAIEQLTAAVIRKGKRLFQVAELPDSLAVSMALQFSSKLLGMNCISLARKILNNVFSFQRKHSVSSSLSSEVCLLKGDIFKRQSRSREAIASYLQSALLDPGNIGAHKAILDHYLSEGTVTQVRVYICKYQTAHPDSLLLSALSSLVFSIFEDKKHVDKEHFEQLKQKTKYGSKLSEGIIYCHLCEAVLFYDEIQFAKCYEQLEKQKRIGIQIFFLRCAAVFCLRLGRYKQSLHHHLKLCKISPKACHKILIVGDYQFLKQIENQKQYFNLNYEAITKYLHYRQLLLPIFGELRCLLIKLDVSFIVNKLLQESKVSRDKFDKFHEGVLTLLSHKQRGRQEEAKSLFQKLYHQRHLIDFKHKNYLGYIEYQIIYNLVLFAYRHYHFQIGMVFVKPLWKFINLMSPEVAEKLKSQLIYRTAFDFELMSSLM